MTNRLSNVQCLCKLPALTSTFRKAFSNSTATHQPIPVAVRYKAWVRGRSLAGIVGSNPPGAWMSVVSVVWCKVEVFATS